MRWQQEPLEGLEGGLTPPPQESTSLPAGYSVTKALGISGWGEGGAAPREFCPKLEGNGSVWFKMSFTYFIPVWPI